MLRGQKHLHHQSLGNFDCETLVFPLPPQRNIDTQKSRIHKEFAHQNSLLAQEEQRQLQRLEKDEREHLRLLGEKEAELAEKNQALQELISELERRSRGSELELLKVRPLRRRKE